MESKNKDTIIVAGVEFEKGKFPHLYKIAKNNPEGLEEQLKSLDRASGGRSDLQSSAINLENDLAHG